MDLLMALALLLVFALILLLVVCIRGDADLSTLCWEKLGTGLDAGLKDKVVWVTGASTGIGAALAMEAVKHGAKVAITARRSELLDKVKDQCIAQGGRASQILVLPLDLCNYAEHKAAFDKVVETFGHLDILVNNAGRSQRARWEHTDIKVDEDLFALNVFSVVNLTRVVLPHMLQRGSGCIALMSSSAGKAGVPFSGTYTGSKHALHGYFESLRTEKMGTGISVCMLCPGPTFSSLLEVAATETPGQSFGESMKATDKRMTAERCAELSLVAIVNKLPESWICFRPVLPLMYASQYLPGISKVVMSVLGPAFLARVRDSRNAMESEKLK